MSDRGILNRRLLVALGLIVVPLTWLLYWWFIDWLVPPQADDNAGIFGDKFGALTSFFSVAAFAGIVLTLLLQREELGKQRELLDETRRDQSRAAFESVFYQLLAMHRDAVASFRESRKKYGEPEFHLAGREVFTAMQEDFLEEYPGTRGAHVTLDEVDSWFVRQPMNFNPQVWPYTQNLQLMLEHIDGSTIADRRPYVRMLASQLSHAELTWIACSAAVVEDLRPLRNLIHRYDLLARWRVDFPAIRAAISASSGVSADPPAESVNLDSRGAVPAKV